MQVNILNSIEERVSTLEMSSKSEQGGGEGGEGEASERIEAVQEEVKKLTADLESLQQLVASRPGPAAEIKELEEALWGKVRRAERQVLNVSAGVVGMVQGLQERLDELEGSKEGGGARDEPELEDRVQETFGRMFEELINPEIILLRESCHALETLVGKPMQEEEEQEASRYETIFETLKHLKTVSSEQEKVAGQLDSLALQVEEASESLTDVKAELGKISTQSSPPPADNKLGEMEKQLGEATRALEEVKSTVASLSGSQQEVSPGLLLEFS